MTLPHTQTHILYYIPTHHSDTGRCWEQLASKRRYTFSTRRPIWYASNVNIDSFKVAAATTDYIGCCTRLVRPTIYYMRIAHKTLLERITKLNMA